MFRTFFRLLLALFFSLAAFGGSAWTLRTQPLWEITVEGGWARHVGTNAGRYWFVSQPTLKERRLYCMNLATGEVRRTWALLENPLVSMRNDNGVTVRTYSRAAKGPPPLRYQVFHPESGDRTADHTFDWPSALTEDGRTIYSVAIRNGQAYFQEVDLDTGAVRRELRLGGRAADAAVGDKPGVVPPAMFSPELDYLAILERSIVDSVKPLPKVEIWDLRRERLAAVVELPTQTDNRKIVSAAPIYFGSEGVLEARLQVVGKNASEKSKFVEIPIWNGPARRRPSPAGDSVQPLKGKHEVITRATSKNRTMEAWLLGKAGQVGGFLVFRPCGSDSEVAAPMPDRHIPTSLRFASDSDVLVVSTYGTQLPLGAFDRFGRFIPAGMRIDLPKRVDWRVDRPHSRWTKIGETPEPMSTYQYDRDRFFIYGMQINPTTTRIVCWSLYPPNRFPYAVAAGLLMAALTWRFTRRRRPAHAILPAAT